MSFIRSEGRWDYRIGSCRQTYWTSVEEGDKWIKFAKFGGSEWEKGANLEKFPQGGRKPSYISNSQSLVIPLEDFNAKNYSSKLIGSIKRKEGSA